MNDANFLKAIQKNCIPVAHCGLLDNAFRVLTPSGKELSHHDVWPSEAFAKGLQAWKKLPESERKPSPSKDDLPKIKGFTEPPRPPAHGLVLKVYSRALQRDSQGKLYPVKRLQVGAQGYPAEPQLDFVWIKENEWKALIPASAQKGSSTPVPNAIVQRIVTFHLLDKGLGTPAFFWQKAAGEMEVTVEETTADSLRMRLDGTALLRDQGDYPVRFLGRLSYDRNKKILTRFDLLALGQDGGDHRSDKERHGRVSLSYELRPDCKPLLAVAFELAHPSANTAVPPYAIMFDSEKHYHRKYFQD